MSDLAEYAAKNKGKLAEDFNNSSCRFYRDRNRLPDHIQNTLKVLEGRSGHDGDYYNGTAVNGTEYTYYENSGEWEVEIPNGPCYDTYAHVKG